MYTVRAMVEADLADVYAIEQTTLSPWSPAMLYSELKIRESRQLVAVSASDSLVGWCCCRLVPPEAELLKIAVGRVVRRAGIGSKLLKFLEAELVENNIATIFLEVRSKNNSALNFYRNNNFYKVGQRPNYYTDPDDDALILQHKFRQENI